MPTVAVDDVELYYEERGEGEPILFLHGLGSSTRDWFEQVSHFADRYRVIACDLRGHGRSSVPRGPYHMAQFARDVAVLLRRIEAAPAHVVGLSMGGMVALELAAGAPELVRRLVVINSVAEVGLRSWGDLWFYLSRRLAVQVLGMRRVGELIADGLFVHPDQEDLRREFARRWAENDQQAYLWSIDAIAGWSVADRLGHIGAPTLLISSDHDYTPVATKNRMAARIPDARLAVIDDTRHAAPVEAPEAVNEAIDRFLAMRKAEWGMRNGGG